MSTILAFGEILLRLSAPKGVTDQAPITAYYGGTESNVLATLSGFGESTEFLTLLPANPLGEGALAHLKAYRVGATFVSLTQPTDRLGTYYSANLPGEKARKVTYDRENSAITTVDPARLDLDRLFAGVALFHVSGISLALAPSCAKTALLLAHEAKRRGISVSFDVNYREALWNVEEAKKTYQSIMDDVDFLFASAYDLTTFFSFPASDPYSPFFARHGVKAIFSTVRGENPSPLIGTMGAEAHWRTSSFTLPKQKFKLIDRIGSGDAFDAGVLEILLHQKENYPLALANGLACAILKHKVKGDVLLAKKEDVEGLRDQFAL
jgi:2-dehydro-3-deoxygluconokinase